MKWWLGVLVTVAFALFAPRAGAVEVHLLTMGPTNYLFSRWGHTLACAVEDGQSEGICYDYGVPDTTDVNDMAWRSYRGKPAFTVVRIPMTQVFDAYKAQDRNIERQKLPLSPDEAKRLAELLERDAASRMTYAYHPYYANCSTKVRDHIDAVTSGKLHAGADVPRANDARLLRHLSEEPLSGQFVELGLMAITLGTPAERKPTIWESQFQPTGLRDAVRERLGADPELVYDRKEVLLPASQNGRFIVIVIGLVLAAIAVRNARRAEQTWKLTKMGVGVALGLFGVIVDFVALTCAFPEFSRNWALLVLVPTDLALGFLSGMRLRRYLEVRLALSAALLVGSLAGLVHQQMIAPVLLACLPLVVVLLRERGLLKERAPKSSARVPVGTA